MSGLLHDAICDVVKQATGVVFQAHSFSSCQGGCIHQSWICSDGDRSFFVKSHDLEAEAMFTAEADGLRAMAEADALRTPKVIGQGTAAGQSFLVLEALDLNGRPSSNSWSKMGDGLAALHRISGPSYGWDSDNFIGKTSQANRRCDSWAEFFVTQRLRPQFDMAQTNGFSFPDTEGLMNWAADLLADHQPAPSLLHGDLWSGNTGFDSSGEPAIFDPAAYHGDRETDLAFTEFFGGFAPEFYAAYRKASPLEPGYEQRRDLYNLYHVLNHANLFGGGYASQAQSMMRALTA